METIGMIFLFIGMIIAFIYSVKLIIIAFSESVLWGLLYLFLPFANLYFIITRWAQCKDPVIKALLCIPFIIIGVLLMPLTVEY
ncbi:hypothetical protein [Psychrobacter sp. M13]|uniref:hypothetical protein n=1 Tax=Psychrobacter sp. M13 TaxID=3067275 RepID=UPI00273B4CD9|nr:hypothetical protein [Psychrobacter sp. M13]WLP93570.1 hypothetical protein Q9G97_08160 [Psychrobacter sp. M13]